MGESAPQQRGLPRSNALALNLEPAVPKPLPGRPGEGQAPGNLPPHARSGAPAASMMREAGLHRTFRSVRSEIRQPAGSLTNDHPPVLNQGNDDVFNEAPAAKHLPLRPSTAVVTGLRPFCWDLPR